jgi:DMSO/TMAO reductase YedYZ molybdopterin-dependent catalytic subunit
MKKTLFLPVTATIIGILLVAFFGHSLNSTAHADSSNADWQLTVTGLVEHPLNLTLADLFAMPRTTIYAQIIWAGPPAFLVAEGNWTGVKLWLLLQETGVLNGTVKVAFYAEDGYTTDLTRETTQRNDVILAYEKDGVALNETLRLVVPGQWGYKWISQVTGIVLVDYNFLGVYESRGYPDDGVSMPNIPSSSPPLTSPPNPKPSNSSNPIPSQTQSPSQNSSSNPPALSPQPKPQAEIEQGGFLKIEFFYAIVAVISITIIVVTVLEFKKRR